MRVTQKRVTMMFGNTYHDLTMLRDHLSDLQTALIEGTMTAKRVAESMRRDADRLRYLSRLYEAKAKRLEE